MTKDPLKPSPSLLSKLGSIAVHVDEMLSLTGHQFDREIIKSLLADSEVMAWIEQMDAMAMLPKKRKIEDFKLAAQNQIKR